MYERRSGRVGGGGGCGGVAFQLASWCSLHVCSKSHNRQPGLRGVSARCPPRAQCWRTCGALIIHCAHLFAFPADQGHGVFKKPRALGLACRDSASNTWKKKKVHVWRTPPTPPSLVEACKSAGAQRRSLGKYPPIAPPPPPTPSKSV